MISASDLHYFQEIAQTSNVSRAAERLGISQPSLSQAMQRMEHAVGEALFIRHKRGVTLTPAGHQLLTHARALLDLWDSIKAKTSASMHEIRGSYTIGCHPSVALYSLGAFLPRTLKQHTALDVRIVHDLSRKITEGVISSKIDVGIVVNPTKHPDLLIQNLATDEVTLWKSAKAKDANSDILICDQELTQSQTIMRKLDAGPVKISRFLYSNNLEVVCELCASGCGVAILPTRVAERAKSPLVKVTGAPVYKDQIAVVIRVENKPVAALRHLTNAIKGSFSPP